MPRNNKECSSCIIKALLCALMTLLWACNGNCQSPIQIIEDAPNRRQVTTSAQSPLAPASSLNQQTEFQPQSQQFVPNQKLGSKQQNILIPINLVSLEFEAAKPLSSTWGEVEASELIGQLNQIYQQYGIEWKLNDTNKLKVNATQYQEVHFQESIKSFLSKITRAIGTPGQGSRSIPTIYVIKSFPKGAEEVAINLPQLNSVLFSERTEAKGKGSPAILAHELGHNLGLTDIPPNESNLMSKNRPKGMQATTLYAHQLALIRKNALKKSQSGLASINSPKNNLAKSLPNQNQPREPKNSETIFRQVGSGTTQNY